MRLVYKASQKEVKVSDRAILAERESVIVTGWAKPHSPASTGRVYVRHEVNGQEREYFPSVVGAEWIEREDRR